MGGKTKTVTAAVRLASVLMVVCVAAGQQPSAEVVTFCSATAFKETCIKSLANATSTDPKEEIKAAFDSAVAEIQSAIKRTATYKRAAMDKLTQGALRVCEDALNSSIFSVGRSFASIDKFELGSSEHVLHDIKVWLSAAITCKSTCIDAFAKTRGDTGKQVREILKTSGELLSNSLAMVIEFQKVYQSLNLGAFTDRIRQKQRQLLGGTPPISLPARVTVAQDGSGDFKTIQEAVKTVPIENAEPFVILVRAGVYQERVIIPRLVNNIVLVGEGPLKTRITGNKNMVVDKLGPYESATLTVEGDSFIAKDIAIENTAGPGGEQAVAVRLSGDLGIYYNVHMDGYQDTVFAHSNRQLYRECRISGTVDFIFGNAIAVFQKCELVVRKPRPGQGCMVTAQGRDERNLTGVTIIQGCKFTAEQDFLDANPPFKAYLGRPWKYLSRTIIMQSVIEAFIAPEGWSRWQDTNLYLDTLFYVEYDNIGVGAENRPPGRVNWKGIHSFANLDEARSFTAKPHFDKDDWVYRSGVPYDDGFMDTNEVANFFSHTTTTTNPSTPHNTFSPQKTAHSPKKPPKKPTSHKNKKPSKPSSEL